MRLHSVSKQFVAQLLPLTTHKRHTVRIAALQAIRVIMHQVSWSRARWGGVRQAVPAVLMSVEA